MKTKLVFLLALLVASFSSCMEETEIDSGDGVDVPEGTAALKLVFKGLGTSEAKSYATVTSLTATADESKLDSVRIYVFNAKDTLENVYMAKPAIGAASGQYEANVLLNEGGAKHLVAIGNPDVKKVPGLMETPIGDLSFDEFKKLTTLAADQMPVFPFVMFGELNTTITMNKTNTVEMELSRLVARIDVINRDSLGSENHRFLLDKVRLMKAASGAYLVPQPNMSAEVRLLENLPWIENTTNPSTGVMNGMMRSVLYTYENAKEGETYLQIAGRFNGRPAQYEVPFEGKALKPNNLYVVMIDSVTSTAVKAQIYIREWESDTITFTPTADAIPYVEVSPGGLKAFIGDARPAIPSEDYQTDTIWFKNNAVDTTRFKVINENVQVVFHSDSSWVTVKEKVETYAKVNQEFVIEVAKNESGKDRMTLIEFRNAAQPARFKRYCIKQAGIPLVDLAKWAEYNLTGLREPADLGNWRLSEEPGDDKNVGLTKNYGKWFQWGRNVPFTSVSGTPPTGEANDGGPVNPGTAKIAGYKFINGGSSNIWLNGGNNWDTWYSEAKRAGLTTQAMDDKGMDLDDTDPCPAGWRLPTVEEIAEIMPINGTVGTYGTSLNANYVAEKTTGYYYTPDGQQHFIESTGPASYAGGGTGIVYGVKKQKTEYATAYRWEYKSGTESKYLKITGLKVDSLASVSLTTKGAFEALDWDNNPDAVVRYFPAAGYRNSNDGSCNWNSAGHYWSSSASSGTHAWFLDFGSSDAYLRTDGNRAHGLSVRCVAQ